mgnify:CR=1 FL=1
MKPYNLYPIEKEFSWGKMNVIELGEEGRGRKLTYIPFHAPKDAQYVEIATTRTGKPKIIESQNSQGWLTRINTLGAYTRNTDGWILVPLDYYKNIKVVAYGEGAWGDAGRLGRWTDYLLEIKDNTLIRVCPSGGSYKIPRYWLWFGENKVLEITNEVFDFFLEEKGLEINNLGLNENQLKHFNKIPDTNIYAYRPLSFMEDYIKEIVETGECKYFTTSVE